MSTRDQELINQALTESATQLERASADLESADRVREGLLAEIQAMRERAQVTASELADLNYAHDELLRDAARLDREAVAARERAERAESDAAAMREVVEFCAEYHDAGRHDGKPEPYPAHSAEEMFVVASDALSRLDQREEGKPRFRGCERLGRQCTPPCEFNSKEECDEYFHEREAAPQKDCGRCAKPLCQRAPSTGDSCPEFVACDDEHLCHMALAPRVIIFGDPAMDEETQRAIADVVRTAYRKYVDEEASHAPARESPADGARTDTAGRPATSPAVPGSEARDACPPDCERPETCDRKGLCSGYKPSPSPAPEATTCLHPLLIAGVCCDCGQRCVDITPRPTAEREECESYDDVTRENDRLRQMFNRSEGERGQCLIEIDRLRKDLCQIAEGCGVGVPDIEEAKRRIIGIRTERDQLKAQLAMVSDATAAEYDRQIDALHAQMRDLRRQLADFDQVHRQQLADQVRIAQEALDGLAERDEKIEELRGVCAALSATVERRTQRIEALEKAIRWALGENGEFERPLDAKRYWWRSELRRRAALEAGRKGEE